MSDKRHIAVIGGGPSALTAVERITSIDGWQDRFDITVYQMGWRLGGKLAGHRAPPYNRIEEHGLHMIFGFYQNFFRMMRDCYDELGRHPDEPLATWREAFLPYSLGVAMEPFRRRWQEIAVDMPRNGAEPGRGEALNDSVTYLHMLVHLAAQVVIDWDFLRPPDGLFYASGEDWERQRSPDSEKAGRPDFAVKIAKKLLMIAQVIVGRSAEHIRTEAPYLLRAVRAARKMMEDSFESLTALNSRQHRFWTFVDFATVLIKGILVDGVLLEGGYRKIDKYDYREWLRRHGAYEETLRSAYVNFVYDSCFSFIDGDPGQPSIAAGSALRGTLRNLFTYKGASYYKMPVGAAEAVVAPLYQVLRARGVRFHFFHKVEKLELDSFGLEIERIRINRQVELRKNLDGSRTEEYDPLIDVDGLPCWPAEPRYELLDAAQAGKLRSGGLGATLESYYSPWDEGTEVVLERGTDFTDVLYAAPVATVPFLCGDLLEHSERWRAMVREVRSVQTVAMQLWFKWDLHDLGWRRAEPLLSGFAHPFSTWADMSQTIRYESWPLNLRPRSISYFCGPQKGPRSVPDPNLVPDFEQRAGERARARAERFVERDLGYLLRAAITSRRPMRFDWGMLVDPHNHYGKQRFDFQYVRANCGPSDRCTIALPGATQYRMRADDTGFENLYITGDWIDNDFNVACVEGAVKSGILAARAMTGEQFEIIGEDLD